MRRPVHRKPLPYKPSDAPPKVDYLPAPALNAMRQELIGSILRTFSQFREFMGDDHVNPRYRAMFEPLMEDADHEKEKLYSEVALLPDEDFQAFCGIIEANLEADIKLYYDRKHDYTLIMPSRRTADTREGASADVCEQLRYYNFALHLFEETQLDRAETNLSRDVNRGTPAAKQDPIDGSTIESHWYQFHKESQLVEFMNRVLPAGKKIAPSGEVQRLI